MFVYSHSPCIYYTCKCFCLALYEVALGMPSLASTKRCPPRSQSGTRFLLFPGPRFYPLVNSAFWGPISSGAPSGLFFLKTSEAPDGALEKQAAGCTQEGEWGTGKKKNTGPQKYWWALLGHTERGSISGAGISLPAMVPAPAEPYAPEHNMGIRTKERPILRC